MEFGAKRVEKTVMSCCVLGCSEVHEDEHRDVDCCHVAALIHSSCLRRCCSPGNCLEYHLLHYLLSILHVI